MSKTAQRIEITEREPAAALAARCRQAQDFFGIRLAGLEEVKVYKISADKAVPPHVLQDVFANPVLQQLHTADNARAKIPAYVAEISFRPGVTDNAARAAEMALRLTGTDARVASSSLYFLYGDLHASDAAKIAEEMLANPLIQKIDVLAYADFAAQTRFNDVRLPTVQLDTPQKLFDTVDLHIDDAALEKLSLDRCLALSLGEMKHIRDFYAQPQTAAARAAGGLPAAPTDVEIEILAQSWSEHCKHKIFAADIDYTGPDGTARKLSSLYKSFIKRATEDVRKDRGLDWLISVFSDNAGIVRFDDNIDLCIKAETHNSPSALDPYGGALTGILGVNRDILGAGMGAKPIANTDVFCFAPPHMPEKGRESEMPQGPKSPRQILEGVHKGVEDGGNKSGIPTVNGAFFFDEDYAGKPLVFVGTVGVMPQKLPDGRASAEKHIENGDCIVMTGGAIGADGIHGATFSSLAMDENAPATAVQIGDALTQKLMTDFLLEARDLGLYRAITDNGAGGLSSSVGEMAQMSGGATLDLARCPVKYPGLAPWELMVSESQERMTLAVPPEHLDTLLALAARRGVVASMIGHFNDSGDLHVAYDGATVASLPLHFIHDSLPPLQLEALWDGPRTRPAWRGGKREDKRKSAPETLTDTLLHLLATPNITSKEKWVRAYDHEVQAATHVKPFGGVQEDAPNDAGAIWLYPHGGAREHTAVIGCGMAPRLSPHDPYLMAQYAVDEAVRNTVATGGDPDMLCLLDNFCWPDPVKSAKNPDGDYKMGQLVRACEGLYDICRAYGAPLVSGKDSMKNDFRGLDKSGQPITISVLPTLMVTAMARGRTGIACGSYFKAAGDVIYLLGGAETSFCASEYAAQFKAPDDQPLPLDTAAAIDMYRRLHAALSEGLLQSLHDLSDGGLLCALAESMIGGRLGAVVDSMDSRTAFGEAPARFIASLAPAQTEAFEALMQGSAMRKIGTVTDDSQLAVGGESIALADILAAWQKGF
ncbi:MAG: AIR synthase-related protein [Alphaproteobacteria bacterium]|nr:AIR synthase-related protein [Alphaproteobacteria bacterium]